MSTTSSCACSGCARHQPGRARGVGNCWHQPRLDRRAIRRQKIVMLAPHENAKTVIECQIIDIDHRTMWVERFGKSDD